MFNREVIQSYLDYPITDELWEKIADLEDCNDLIRRPTYDYRGKQFSNLVAIGRGPTKQSGKNKNSIAMWWCICNCPEHNIILARSGNLTSGNTKSCGCRNTERRRQHMQKVGRSMALDLTNKQFGELTALRMTDERKYQCPVWECKCSCGKIHYVTSHDLVNHRIESCGHSYDSRGVRRIKNILNKNEINYITEKTFPDCKSPTSNVSLRFDFYLPDYNLLIEFDGKQHFVEDTKNFFRDTLQDRQIRDNIKNQYCKEHNIPLVRIPYWEVDNISLNMILGPDFLVV